MGPSSGGHSPYSLVLEDSDMQVLGMLWGVYFDGQVFIPHDPKMQVIACFRGFLVSDVGVALLTKGCKDLQTAHVVTLDYGDFCKHFQVQDFQQILYERPAETLACLGLALCLARKALLQTSGEACAMNKIAARFVNVEPVIPMASLKSSTVAKFVSLRATVVRCSAIRPLVLRAEFECSKCGTQITQSFPDGTFTTPESCPTPNCRNRTFELRRDSAETVDFQKIKVQEVDDNNAEPGRMPRTVEVELWEDLVDSCIPGDEVVVAGIVKTMNAEAASGRRPARDGRHQSLYLLYLHANTVTNRRRSEREEEEDEDDNTKVDASKSFHLKHLYAIRMIANDRFCFELLVASLCPSIFGHELVKAGLILTLMGGSKRQNPTCARTRVRVRSDPHILLVGDPGLGKSQLLKAASAAAPRSVYVCGQVVTSTGLTVTLVNEGRGDVGLEAGALVLSDQGVCCIDELDKLSCSFHALLEAMEQQQVSIAKSGVVASLSARCSVIAAANPAGGHYHRGKTVSENLKMSGALFSRFDLVFIMLDRPDENHDQRLSRHIVNMHAQRNGATFAASGPSQASPEMSLSGKSSADRSERTLSQRLRLVVSDLVKDPIPHEILRKYIAYARKYIHPRLTPAAAAVLKELYLKMREEARLGRSMPITLRQLESLIRLSQARARAELREWVTEDDALDVVEMMQESLLDAYTNETGEVDFAHHSGSMSLAKQVKAFVAQLNKESDKRGTSIFQKTDLMELAERMHLKIADFDRFLDVLNAECYLLKKGPRLYQVATSNSVG